MTPFEALYSSKCNSFMLVSRWESLLIGL